MKPQKCKNCGKEFSRNLTHCPYCDTRTPAASTFLTIACTVAAMCIIMSIILLPMALEDTPPEANYPSQTDYPSQEVENKPEIHYIEVTADDIFSAFEENEIAADQKFKGQLVKITGTVSEINSKSTLTSANVLLNVDGPVFGCVQCNFNSENSKALAAVEKGQSVTIIGTCEGMSWYNVMINACELQ